MCTRTRSTYRTLPSAFRYPKTSPQLQLHSQRVLAQRGRQLGKAVCSLEKLPFPPEFGLFSGRGTGLIQLNLHQQNCLKPQEKQQKGQSERGREGGMLSGQPNPSLPTDTYCTTVINRSPFGLGGETNNNPAVSEGLQTKSTALFGLPAPRSAQP